MVAEGIETLAELAAVRSVGCDLLQGFLLGRPVPMAQLGRVAPTLDEAVGSASL